MYYPFSNTTGIASIVIFGKQHVPHLMSQWLRL